jgi:hypothetical protein
MGKHHRGGQPAAEERQGGIDEAHRHERLASEEGASTGAKKQRSERDRSHHGDKRGKR